MNRLLTLLALAGLLVACTGQGDGTTDQTPDPATGTTAPASPATTADATSGADATSAPSAECDESFAALEEMQVSSITELGDLGTEVEPTIEACDSVDEWIAGARDAIDEDINPNTAALLLRMNCGDPSLSRTELCRELTSS